MTTTATKKIRVVHLITDLDVGGAEMMLARLLTRLDSPMVENAVVSLGGRGAVAERIERSGIPVSTLGLRPGRVNPLALWHLVALLRRLRPDVLQTWLYHSDLAGLIGGRLAHVPAIVWNIRCAELDPRDHPRSLPMLLRMLAFSSRWPSAVVCNSNAGRLAHEQLGYSPRRWIVIPNGFDVDAFRPCSAARVELRRELGVAADGPLVGLLARFHPMKDHATFLRAAKIAARAREDVRFVVAGRGVSDNRALASLVSDLALQDRVRLLPERSDAPRFLAALDVAVSSSYGEAFPNIVGEAMSCGTPCVATDVGDSAALVGETGVIVPSRDPERLAAGMLRLLDLTPDRRAALGESARQHITSKFSLDRAVRAYEGLYLELGSGDTGGGRMSTCAG
jgi:glycosyltransferase involved in cell wall biosynthesis